MDKLQKFLEECHFGEQEERTETLEGERRATYSWPGWKKDVTMTVWLPEDGRIQFKSNDYPVEWYWFTNEGIPFDEGVVITKELTIPGEIEDLVIFEDGEVLEFNERELIVFSEEKDGYYSLHNSKHRDDDNGSY